MDELGFDIGTALSWFLHERDDPYVLVRVSEEQTRVWADALGVPVRRCYITDALLEESAALHGVSMADVLASKLPDPGSTMSGDFGEILVFLYQAAKEHPRRPIGPKKWRLKQDRTKPAPHSDIVQFVLPSWPVSTSEDVLLCSEVKAKATAGESSPIQDAIAGSAKDRTSRLARTLAWLRERALTEDLGNVTVAHLDRFINATDHPPSKKRFRAVAVVSADLVETELADAPTEVSTDYSVVVISVPQLRQVYSQVFAASRRSVDTASAPSVVSGNPR